MLDFFVDYKDTYYIYMANKSLTIQSSNEELKSYFEAVCRIVDSNRDEFPINLDEVWPLVYQRKDHAVRDLAENFIQDVDYQVSPKNGENPLGGRPTNEYRLTTSCFEFFIARKVRPVFEVYRQVFHAARRGGLSTANQQFLLHEKMMAAKWAADFLNLNEVSKLRMAKQILDPLGLPIPDYVPSKGVKHSAKELLLRNGIQMSAQSLNKALAKAGILKQHARPGKGGKVHKWYVITDSGERFGENDVCPQNPKQTQPLWYDNMFSELVDVAVRAVS